MKVATKNNHLFPSIFNDLFIENRLDTANKTIINNPKVNIIEKDASFEVMLAAPGLKKEDFTIEVEKGTLVISSEIKEKKTETLENFTRREFNYGNFRKSFTVTDTIDTDKISAAYENGILKIELPKVEVAIEKKKMIEIS